MPCAVAGALAPDPASPSADDSLTDAWEWEATVVVHESATHFAEFMYETGDPDPSTCEGSEDNFDCGSEPCTPSERLSTIESLEVPPVPTPRPARGHAPLLTPAPQTCSEGTPCLITPGNTVPSASHDVPQDGPSVPAVVNPNPLAQLGRPQRGLGILLPSDAVFDPTSKDPGVLAQNGGDPSVDQAETSCDDGTTWWRHCQDVQEGSPADAGLLRNMSKGESDALSSLMSLPTADRSKSGDASQFAQPEPLDELVHPPVDPLCAKTPVRGAVLKGGAKASPQPGRRRKWFPWRGRKGDACTRKGAAQPSRPRSNTPTTEPFSLGDPVSNSWDKRVTPEDAEAKPVRCAPCCCTQ